MFNSLCVSDLELGEIRMQVRLRAGGVAASPVVSIPSTGKSGMKHIGITGGSQSFGAGDVERPNSPPARPLHRFQSVVVPGDSVG